MVVVGVLSHPGFQLLELGYLFGRGGCEYSVFILLGELSLELLWPDFFWRSRFFWLLASCGQSRKLNVVTNDFVNLNAVYRKIDRLWVEFIAHGKLLKP